LGTEFNKYEAIPALHGLHHYRYDNLPKNRVNNELTAGIQSLKKLFSVRVEVFTPPFNAWNHNTELVCESLNLRIDKCYAGFDKLIKNMNSSQIIQLAKNQSSTLEVNYHPQRLASLEKFELYLKTRRKYC
jgi:peptidoglycan/xylan/chitin deacetylase (PgdA/CDA1 family)